MTQFSYCPQKSYMGQLDVEDIGNCAIHIMAASPITMSLDEYYMVIRTVRGRTSILQYGPRHIELKELPGKVFLSYQSFEYSPSKVGKCITSFLTDAPGKSVSAAETVDFGKAYGACRSLIELMTEPGTKEEDDDDETDTDD